MARCNDPDRFTSISKNYRHDPIMRSTNREPSLLIVAVRSTQYDWFIKDLDRVAEINSVFDAILLVLLFVPIEASQDQFSYVFVRHNPHSRLKIATFIAFLPGAVGRRPVIYVYTIVFLFDQGARRILLAVSAAAPVNRGLNAKNFR